MRNLYNGNRNYKSSLLGMLNWNKIYTNRLQATKDIRLQNFQYKCLMRNLKCKIGETALCEICTMEIETINHLFWECYYVQHFWANLATFLLRYNITMHFSLKYVTFGITERAHCIKTQVENFIILLGKYFIFKNKCLTLNQQYHILKCTLVKE